MTPTELHEVAITLENDGKFYRDYQGSRAFYGRRRNLIGSSASRAGCKVNIQADREQLRRYFDDTIGGAMNYDDENTDNELDHLPTIEFWKDEVRNPPERPPDLTPRIKALQTYLERGYGGGGGSFNLDDYKRCLAEMKLTIEEANAFCDKPITAQEPDVAITYNHIRQPVTETTETAETIMTKAIEITTKTFVNGADLANLADAQVYELISAEEARIKELNNIENKPKKLLAEIAKRQAGIKALVDHLDSKE